jgi:hypothetical protein
MAGERTCDVRCPACSKRLGVFKPTGLELFCDRGHRIPVLVPWLSSLGAAIRWYAQFVREWRERKGGP